MLVGGVPAVSMKYLKNGFTGARASPSLGKTVAENLKTLLIWTPGQKVIMPLEIQNVRDGPLIILKVTGPEGGCWHQ